MKVKINIYQGDCLIEYERIKNGSADLILTDLPYGNMKNTGLEITQNKKKRKHNWDFLIEPKKIYEIANRVLRKNGKMILFSQEPYTSQMITKAIPNLPFNYRAIWEKNNFALSLGINRNMVSYYEDILVFSKTHPKYDFEGTHPVREYFLVEKEIAKLTNTEIKKILGNEMGGHYFTRCSQFWMPTSTNYKKLQTTGYFKRDWKELKIIDDKFKQDFPSVFNLWEGKKYKSNILKYKKDYEGLHPTQKPILLLEDLIKTFSNENNLIVDLTMGSGSTGIACINTNRKFIGIELNKDYFEIAKKRIDNHKVQFQLY